MKFLYRINVESIKNSINSRFFYYGNYENGCFAGIEYDKVSNSCQYGGRVKTDLIFKEFDNQKDRKIPNQFKRYIRSNIWLLDIPTEKRVYL